MDLEIIKYSDEWENKWDRFIFERSANGTFLQTRNFINYHPKNRFKDTSLLIMQGNNIVAVIPACGIYDKGKRCFFSHKGSTFGGILLDKNKYKIPVLENIFPQLENYLVNDGYDSVFIKNTPAIFARISPELLDYYFYKNDYRIINELSFYIDCQTITQDITKSWTASRRRDFKYALKNDLRFKRLISEKEVSDFYKILKDSLLRHGVEPVHSLTELIDFKNSRLVDVVDFYGVFYKEVMIAGAMLFYFGKEVLHTQYLAQDVSFSNLFTMNFLNYNLIKLAKDNGFNKFSFGISTENCGKTLNKGLAIFKEGFGTQFCNNRSYFKVIR